ncbi:MAG: PorV/PorQ family protein [Elusimicrobia bacterium]|nr:PorV/PorQ family protein [Elusimicrobiota bacterium]
MKNLKFKIKNLCFLPSIILHFTFCIFNCLHAKGPGTTSAIFLRQPLGARSFGLGNTYTGISNDIEALWFNTAGICEIEYPVVSALFSDDISGTNHGFIAFALPMEKFTAAVSVSALQTEKIEITPQTRAAYNLRPESDYIAMFALGVPVGGFIDVGGGVKFLHSELAEEYIAKTVAFDGGFLLRGLKHPKIGEISVGVSYQNLGKKIKYDEKYNDLPQILRGGVAIKKNKKNVGELVVGYDISKITGSDIHHNFGIELTAFDKWLAKPLTSFSIRAGYGLGYSTEGLSFGAGFGLAKIRCDYGLQLTDFETRHKFLVTYSFEPDTPEENMEE